MMVLSALRPDASLLEFLAHRARSASVRRLSIDALVGVAAFAAAVRWESAAQLTIAMMAACLMSYGAWGLLDRARSRLAIRRWARSAGLFEALSALVASVGILAAAGFLFAVWAIALGTWIS
jgi:hypothetical protein